MHGADELGAEHGDGVVGGEQRELAFLLVRDEVGPAAEDPFQQVTGGGGAVEQGVAEGGQLILAADAGQQLVVEVAAQAGQSRAHRGLAQPDALAGARDVALLQQCAQGQNEVEVETGQIHNATVQETAPGQWYLPH